MIAGGPDLRLAHDRYEAVGDYLHGLTGIRLRAGKEALVVSRLGRRVRATAMPTLNGYIDAILDGRIPEELPHFIDVLTTNKTNFFREAAHFRHLVEKVFPRLAATSHPIRIWSAACSSGEEPYTLGMVVRDSLPVAAQSRTRILATDISNRILETARTARYAGPQLHGLEPEMLRRHLDREPGASGAWTVKREVRDFVRFARLNLMETWPMKGQFDIIFCRNAMIYFDRQTQERLVGRFLELLVPGGTLCVGHAESLSGISHGLEVIQPSVYRKPAGPA